MTERLYSESTRETEAIGRALAARLRARGARRAFVALYGEMGVGKTAFTRGFAEALGISGTRSPTYTIVNEYRGGDVPVFHFDMYRIESEDDLFSIGFDDYLASDGYVVCEWSEKIPDAIPPDAICVEISRTDDGDGRAITIESEAEE